MTKCRSTLLAEAHARLAHADVASPEYDAANLLAHVLGVPRSALPSIPEVTADDATQFSALIDRRVAREPLQHIIGMAAFRYVELKVGPGVFVPRPETELLAGWAIDRAREVIEKGETPLLVDLCTGSGAIALSVVDEVPEARVYAVELDIQAYSWAVRNVAGTSITVHQGDFADALPHLDATVDVVVCNPPYIPLDAWESVAPEARDHDPHLSLFSGSDGLDAMRSLERTATRLLKPGGWVGAEHAEAQGEVAPAVFAATGRWVEVRDHRDFNNRPRFLTARAIG